MSYIQDSVCLANVAISEKLAAQGRLYEAFILMNKAIKVKPVNFLTALLL